MDALYGQRSTYPKVENHPANWVLVDAKDQVLGRLAAKIVTRLLGKHKVDYQPGVMLGDSVVIINAANVKVTGNKLDQKDYIWHSGYLGGLKRRSMREQMQVSPEKVLYTTIQGMLPKTKFGKKLMTNLRIFAGNDHNMQAQNPQEIKL